MKEADCVRAQEERKKREQVGGKKREKERQEEGNTVHEHVWNTNREGISLGAESGMLRGQRR